MLLTVLVLLAAAPGPAVSPSAGGSPREYSVEIRSYFAGAPGPGGFTGVTKVFVGGPDRTRLEGYDEAGQLLSIAVHRLDRNAVYTIRTSERTYREQPASELMAAGDVPVPFTLASYQDKVRRGVVTLSPDGHDTVAGQPCDKYTIVYTRVPAAKAMHLWVSTLTGLTVQYALGDGLRTRKEWTNLRIGPQPASLFEVPAGYKKDGPWPPRPPARAPGPASRTPGTGSGTPRRGTRTGRAG